MNYWEKYYKNSKKLKADKQFKPSPFVFFCKDFIKHSDVVVDIGAGSGRDANYLHERFTTIAVEPNNDFYIQSSFEDYAKKETADIDVIYARWFLHSVSEKVEDLLLDFAISKKAKLMLEFRVLGDKPDNTHKRRLIDLDKFTKKLLDKNFTINHLSKNYGYSKVDDNDPLLARVICEPQGRARDSEKTRH